MKKKQILPNSHKKMISQKVKIEAYQFGTLKKMKTDVES